MPKKPSPKGTRPVRAKPIPASLAIGRNRIEGEVAFWLVKTEPEVFSIQDLARQPNRTTYWDGVRNYQARNYLREGMRKGDRVLVYHSNAEPAGVVGVARVASESYPDFTAWDRSNPHFDPDSSPDNPRWFMVDLRLERIFPHILSLDALRATPELAAMELLRRGSRLSVQPVRPNEFALIEKMAR